LAAVSWSRGAGRAQRTHPPAPHRIARPVTVSAFVNNARQASFSTVYASGVYASGRIAFERRLRRRNPASLMGEASEGAVEAPSD